MKLRTLIADDEPLARERLKQLLAPDPEIEIAGECRNGSEVVTALKGTQIDLLFLDIQMPGSSGFDVIESVGLRNMPLTVFVTAHSQFAVEAFAVHALHYLVKPVERRHLEEAVSRVKERVRLQETSARPPTNLFRPGGSASAGDEAELSRAAAGEEWEQGLGCACKRDRVDRSSGLLRMPARGR